VLVIEDGPTATHGNMKFGAATVAAKNYGAKEIIDAEKYAVGTIKEAYKKYNIKKILPALGYSKKQIDELRQVINNAKCDVVVSATPTDLNRIIRVNKPIVHVSYELSPIGKKFDIMIKNFLKSCE
jgi:predicted GTPase